MHRTKKTTRHPDTRRTDRPETSLTTLLCKGYKEQILNLNEKKIPQGNRLIMYDRHTIYK